MANVFSGKNYNPSVFKLAVENLMPSVKGELGRLFSTRRVDLDLARKFPDQVGGNIAEIVIKGRLANNSQNYDGATTIVPVATANYVQRVVAIGRVGSWQEEDFQTSIGGYSELDAEMYQVADFRNNEVRKAGLSILKGIFASTLTPNQKTSVQSADMIDALVADFGDLGDDIDTVLMDSYVAGELAKIGLLTYGTYQIDGVQYINQKVGYWAGKRVFIDDGCGTNSNASGTKHYVYALAPYSFRYCPLAVKREYEMARDSFTNGGVDAFISRQRFVLAPEGISFVGTPTSLSPTNVELETGANYALVADGNGVAINRKIVPFSCIEITLP